MLGYIMFFAVVLFSLSWEIYLYQEACSNLTKALSVAAIILTSVFAAAGFVLCILIEKGVITL